MILLKVAGFILLIVGALIVYMSKLIVKKFNTEKYIKVKDNIGLNEEEIDDYKFQNANFNIKVLGFLLATPGIIILLVIYH